MQNKRLSLENKYTEHISTTRLASYKFSVRDVLILKAKDYNGSEEYNNTNDKHASNIVSKNQLKAIVGQISMGIYYKI